MKTTTLTVWMLAIASTIAGCASSGSTSARGYEIRIRYAEVEDIERVKLPSNAPAGAVVGGFTGLVLSRNSSGSKQVASGIGGAVLGGLATSALEGDRLGYSYRLRFANGDSSNFITEKSYLQRGDCVSVERGQYANIRRVSSDLCSGSPSPVDREILREAELCHEAKEQLLAASRPEDVESAARKVKIICEY
jgi:outer membrane lipoprotein SlyB